MSKLNDVAVERFASDAWLPPWTRWEHLERYAFAAGFVRGMAVVDCASGSGEGSATFANAGAASVRALDCSEDAVAVARTRYALPNLEFFVGDATALPFPSASADVFISLETIEHVEADRQFVSEVARVLRAGGTLICSTPNRAVTNPHATISDAPWNRHHVREYDRSEFLALFEADFDLVELNGQNVGSPVFEAATAWIGRCFGTLVAVRLKQLLKCRWFISGQSSHHRVQSIQDRPCEYFVAVLRRRAGAGPNRGDADGA